MTGGVVRVLRAATAAALVLVIGPVSPAAAETYATISGVGSTWSQGAIRAWVGDVSPIGLRVNYDGLGSTTGRTQYIQGTTDFAVSEIPFQGASEDGGAENASGRPFVYLPIVAGGTSFMYHVTVGGQRITDLRLSGETITKIFTGQIKNWNDPAITADYGRPLPSSRIQPVVRSDGSGTSAQFSLWMATQYPDLWSDFCVASGRSASCGLTSFYPQFDGSTAQNGSSGVSNFVAASYGEGAITYVEYSYALSLNYPVAKVLNNAGYFTTPTASNVAVALTKAGINADLTQELGGVYNNTDKRTYPLSSYSYMIVPTDTTAPMNAEKGKSLSTFINYFLCEGQQDAEVLGYSPLPLNLVQEGFKQVPKIPGFVAPPADLQACNNPTFEGGRNVLLEDAPPPSECDKLGADLATCNGGAPDPDNPGGGTPDPNNPGGGAPGPNNPGGAGGDPTAPGGVGTDPNSPGGGVVDPANPGGGGAAAPGVDPETGLALISGDGSTGGPQALGVPQTLGAFTESSGQTQVIYGLTALEILLAVTLPPVIAGLLRRRRTRSASLS